MRKRIKIEYFGLKKQFLKLKRELACSNIALQSTKKHLPIKTKLLSLSVTYYPVILLKENSAVLSISIKKNAAAKLVLVVILQILSHHFVLFALTMYYQQQCFLTGNQFAISREKKTLPIATLLGYSQHLDG